jgi:hypothetical protein
MENVNRLSAYQSAVFAACTGKSPTLVGVVQLLSVIISFSALDRKVAALSAEGSEKSRIYTDQIQTVGHCLRGMENFLNNSSSLSTSVIIDTGLDRIRNATILLNLENAIKSYFEFIADYFTPTFIISKEVHFDPRGSYKKILADFGIKVIQEDRYEDDDEFIPERFVKGDDGFLVFFPILVAVVIIVVLINLFTSLPYCK